MAYKHRVEIPGLYHVAIRGNNKRRIVEDDLDRVLFFLILDRVATKYGWELFVVCLMTNHFHLVLRIGERGMSQGMCELNTRYALAFNQRHGRINHLFGKRYWSEQLTTDARFLNACRYVVQNPVRAGITEKPEHYLWSSYCATIGLALGRARIASDELLRWFGPDRKTAIERFRKFCETPVPSRHVRWQPP